MSLDAFKNQAAPNSLFAWAPRHDAERLFKQMQPIRLSSGQMLHRPGEPIRNVYFPVTAVLSLVHQMANGSTAEIAVVGSEGFVGVNLLLGVRSAPDCAMVQIPGEAMRMTSAMFLAQCERRSEFRQRAMHYTESLLRQVSQTAACNRLHSTRQRLCKWLLLRLDRAGDRELAMTQEHIANMLGDRRETISVAGRQLKDAGVIRYSRGRLHVLDRAGLEARACECYLTVRP